MFPEMCDHEPAEPRQRIAVVVELIPGPFIDDLAGRILRLVVQELLELGTDVTSVELQITGPMASW